MWAEVRQTWVKVSASEGKLDKLRSDGIHIKRNGTGRITHSVIFEITRALIMAARILLNNIPLYPIYMLFYWNVIDQSITPETKPLW